MGQQARWCEILEEFDFQIVHRPGVKHGNADALSRRPCPQCGKEVENVIRIKNDRISGNSKRNYVDQEGIDWGHGKGHGDISFL